MCFVINSEMSPSTPLMFPQDSDALAASHDRQVHSELSKAWKEMNVLGVTNGVRVDNQV